MSTEIAEIKTMFQYHKGGKEIQYVDDILHVNRFYGGEERGPMIQLSIVNGPQNYTMLTKEKVKELIQVLRDCFDYDKYPSE